jgi:glyoxylase-like metal-dependent hydrolase (beta-lactamase superfamily II)
VEGDGLAVVDTGLHTRHGEQALRDGLAALGRHPRDVRDVFVTHLHPDHIGMAGLLEVAGARVHLHAPEAEAARRLWFAGRERVDDAVRWFRANGMPEPVLDGMAEAWLGAGERVDRIARIHEEPDGADLALAGRRFRLIWTPGHTDYHAVLYDAAERILVAGDHVLPRITPNVGLYPSSRDDPLADFLASLRRVATLDVRLVLPAHGDPFDDLPGRVEALLAHHRARLEAVREALAAETPRASSIAFILQKRWRSSKRKPTPRVVPSRSDLADIHVQPHNLDIYDELSKPKP